jgi:hypothetical protein
VTDPAAPREIVPPGTTVDQGVTVDYWSWYYSDYTRGFAYEAPRGGKFQGPYFYRAALSILDIHEWTRPPDPDDGGVPDDASPVSGDGGPLSGDGGPADAAGADGPAPDGGSTHGVASACGCGAGRSAPGGLVLVMALGAAAVQRLLRRRRARRPRRGPSR